MARAPLPFRYALLSGDPEAVGGQLAALAAWPGAVFPAAPAGNAEAASMVLALDGEVPPGPLRLPGAPPGLRAQAGAWLEKIFPRASPADELRRPSRMGAGVRAALPLVSACLTAGPGAVLLLEDPETFLGPRSQSTLTRLTCLAAAAGPRVVTATGSDHVLNAVRIAVAHAVLPAADAAVRHFQRPGAARPATASALAMDSRGMLSAWLPGFFDQRDRELDQLLDDAPQAERPPAHRPPSAARRGAARPPARGR